MPLLHILGELERFTTEHLYPLRYVITPLLIGALIGALYVAYRLGAHVWVRRHVALSAAIAVPLAVVGLVAGNYFLSPLWERSHLEEASPLAVVEGEMSSMASGSDTMGTPMTGGADAMTTPMATGSDGAMASGPAAAPSVTPGNETSMPMPTATTAPAFVPHVASNGTFVDADDFHFGRGDAQIIETAPGVYVLRLENFSVRNGPDLFVYLSEDPTGRSVNEDLNLGELKATDGAFNYEIPPEIDVSRVKSAVVWCRQFAVLFTHAELM